MLMLDFKTNMMLFCLKNTNTLMLDKQGNKKNNNETVLLLKGYFKYLSVQTMSAHLNITIGQFLFYIIGSNYIVMTSIH